MQEEQRKVNTKLMAEAQERAKEEEPLKAKSKLHFLSYLPHLGQQDRKRAIEQQMRELEA